MSSFTPESIDLAALPSLPYSERGKLPNCAAVYFVRDEATQTLLYIGQTRSLTKRWIGHHRKAAFAGYGHLRIFWLLITDEESLETVECAAIAHLQPILNSIGGKPPTDRMPNGTYHRIMIRIPPDIMDTLKDRSAREDRSINGELVHLVRQALRTEAQERDDRPRQAAAR